jgi:hypothetical protein
MLTLNHGYQKSTSMVGLAYQAKNEEIKDMLTQINIETGCYDSVQRRLVVATLNTAVQVHLLNTQLISNPELVEWLRKQQQAPPVQNLREQYSDL